MLSRRHFHASALALPVAMSWTTTGLADTARDREMGSSDAPVTIIEYSSLTCPHCASFHKGPLKELKSQYIDTGKVRLVYRDFPTDGLALLVAQLPHCVGDNQYFPLLDQLFAQQQSWRNTAQDADSVALVNDLGLAEKLISQGFPEADVNGVSGILRAIMQIGALAGLSNQQAADCIGDAELRDSIWQRASGGREEFAIQSTPSFVIDGEVHAGSRPIEDFAQIIDPLL